MKYNFKYDVEKVDCQKHIHIIDKYGSRAEKEICSKLRSMTWDMSDDNPSARRYLRNVVTEHIINIALSAKERNLDKNDWFMEL